MIDPLAIVNECYKKLPQYLKEKPWEATDHGRAVLQTEDQLNAYLAAYGEIHIIKCLAALQNLPIDKFNNPFKQGDYCVNDNSYVTATWQNSTNNKGMSGIKYSVCLYCNQYQKCKDYTN